MLYRKLTGECCYTIKTATFKLAQGKVKLLFNHAWRCHLTFFCSFQLRMCYFVGTHTAAGYNRPSWSPPFLLLQILCVRWGENCIQQVISCVSCESTAQLTGFVVCAWWHKLNSKSNTSLTDVMLNRLKEFETTTLNLQCKYRLFDRLCCNLLWMLDLLPLSGQCELCGQPTFTWDLVQRTQLTTCESDASWQKHPQGYS